MHKIEVMIPDVEDGQCSSFCPFYVVHVAGGLKECRRHWARTPVVDVNQQLVPGTQCPACKAKPIDVVNLDTSRCVLVGRKTGVTVKFVTDSYSAFWLGERKMCYEDIRKRYDLYMVEAGALVRKEWYD